MDMSCACSEGNEKPRCEFKVGWWAQLVEQWLISSVPPTYPGPAYCRCTVVEKQRVVGVVVGSCCQGRWCVIFSPLCLFPVGQGLLEQGVADLTE